MRISRRRLLAAMPMAAGLAAGCGADRLIPWAASTATPVPERRVRVATTNKPIGVWTGAQVAAADRRLPAERRLSFDVLPLNPATPDVPPAVSNAFAVWPARFASMLTTLSGESTPDLVVVDSRWVAACARADLLVDLTSLLRAESWFAADAYAGDVLAAGRVRGRQVALPLAVLADGVLYDAGVVQDRGVAPPRADWLWPEVVAAAQALTWRGRWGMALPRDAPSPSVWTLAWQRGAAVVERDGAAMAVSEPGLVEGLRFPGDLVNRLGVARAPEPDPPTVLETLAQRAAAIVGVVHGQSLFWRQPRFAGFAPATWPTGERLGDRSGVFAYAPLMVGVPRGAPRRDLSIEALGALAGAVPEAVLMPAGRRTPGAAPGVAAQMSPDDAAALDRLRADARFLPGDVPYFALAQTLEEELVLPVLAGKKRPEQAVADARSAIDRRLSDFARPA